MKTQMKIKGDQFTIDCGPEHEDMLANFIAAVSTGVIKINYIRNCYPDEKLFVGTSERDYKHSYEILEETYPSFCSVQPLKPKTDVLLQLETKAKAASKKEAA